VFICTRQVHLHPPGAFEAGLAADRRRLDAVAGARQPDRDHAAEQQQHRQQGDQGRQVLGHEWLESSVKGRVL
jgi:hypothetical protein